MFIQKTHASEDKIIRNCFIKRITEIYILEGVVCDKSGLVI